MAPYFATANIGEGGGGGGGGEFTDVLQSLLAVALDGSASNMATTEYYARLARHVRAEDTGLAQLAIDLVAGARASYRTAAEHAHHVARVPMHRVTDRKVAAMLDCDCAFCLKPLRGGAGKLARTRASSGDPHTCGHFFHAECLGEWELHDDAFIKRCPLCRCDLGGIVRTWEDHEYSVPRF